MCETFEGSSTQLCLSGSHYSSRRGESCTLRFVQSNLRREATLHGKSSTSASPTVRNSHRCLWRSCEIHSYVVERRTGTPSQQSDPPDYLVTPRSIHSGFAGLFRRFLHDLTSLV